MNWQERVGQRAIEGLVELIGSEEERLGSLFVPWKYDGSTQSEARRVLLQRESLEAE